MRAQTLPGAEDALINLGVEAERLPVPPEGFEMWLINAQKARIGETQHVVSSAERARAARFVDPALGARYLAAHAALRTLLTHCTGLPHAAQRFRFNVFGKPALADFPNLAFNLSYSGHYALIGLAEGDAIGVDIEVIRPIADADDLMPLHYTPAEQDYVRRAAAAGEGGSEAFLRIWTRKEACIKAQGAGLNIALTGVECGFADEIATVRLGAGAYRAGTMQLGDDVVISWARRLGAEGPRDAAASL